MIEFDIKQFLSLDNYEESRQDRRKGKNATQEFFTPYSIVKKMCDKISEEDWRDKTKTFLEPCAGNFQFICYILWNRLQHGVHWYHALNTIYGIELQEDNLIEGKQRIIKLLDLMNIDYDEDLAMDIMDYNLVCSDFFEWDFENWCKKGEKPRKCFSKIIGDEEYKDY